MNENTKLKEVCICLSKFCSMMAKKENNKHFLKYAEDFKRMSKLFKDKKKECKKNG